MAADGKGLSFRSYENVLKCIDGYRILLMYLETTELYTLNGSTVWSMTYISIKLFYKTSYFYS